MSPELIGYKFIIQQHLSELSERNTEIYFSCKDWIKVDSGLVLNLRQEYLDWFDSDVNNDLDNTLENTVGLTKELLSWQTIAELTARRGLKTMKQQKKQQRRNK